jgi:hypothetical protein
MTSKSVAAVLFMALFWGGATGLAALRPMELKWSELDSVISGHAVELTLPGGARVKGDVAAVREDALAIDVRKTSDAKAYPKGGTTIPRASVTTLRLERSRGHWGRILGPLGGSVAGALLGGYITNAVTDQRDLANLGKVGFVGLVSGVAGGVAGYYLGRVADRKVIVIRIMP